MWCCVASPAVFLLTTKGYWGVWGRVDSLLVGRVSTEVAPVSEVVGEDDGEDDEERRPRASYEEIRDRIVQASVEAKEKKRQEDEAAANKKDEASATLEADEKEKDEASETLEAEKEIKDEASAT
eukprot:1196375-Prorocentrum_minimum.AAC.2